MGSQAQTFGGGFSPISRLRLEPLSFQDQGCLRSTWVSQRLRSKFLIWPERGACPRVNGDSAVQIHREVAPTPCLELHQGWQFQNRDPIVASSSSRSKEGENQLIHERVTLYDASSGLFPHWTHKIALLGPGLGRLDTHLQMGETEDPK